MSEPATELKARQATRRQQAKVKAFWDAIKDSNMVDSAYQSTDWDNLPLHTEKEIERMYHDAVRIFLMKNIK